MEDQAIQSLEDHSPKSQEDALIKKVNSETPVKNGKALISKPTSKLSIKPDLFNLEVTETEQNTTNTRQFSKTGAPLSEKLTWNQTWELNQTLI